MLSSHPNHLWASLGDIDHQSTLKSAHLRTLSRHIQQFALGPTRPQVPREPSCPPNFDARLQCLSIRPFFGFWDKAAPYIYGATAGHGCAGVGILGDCMLEQAFRRRRTLTSLALTFSSGLKPRTQPIPPAGGTVAQHDVHLSTVLV